MPIDQSVLDKLVSDQTTGNAAAAEAIQKSQEMFDRAQSDLMDRIRGRSTSVIPPGLGELVQLLTENPSLVVPCTAYANRLHAKIKNAVDDILSSET